MTGRYESITNDGDLLGRVLAIDSYLGVTTKWLSALFKSLGFNVKYGTRVTALFEVYHCVYIILLVLS